MLFSNAGRSNKIYKVLVLSSKALTLVKVQRFLGSIASYKTLLYYIDLLSGICPKTSLIISFTLSFSDEYTIIRIFSVA